MEASRNPKRMRLGTKSCAECRRRKVRCIFADGDGQCRQCIAHDVACRPQQQQQQQQQPSVADACSGKEDTADIRARLANMEQMFQRACQSLGQQSAGLPVQPSSTGRGMANAPVPSAAPRSVLGVISPDSSDHGQHGSGGTDDTVYFTDAPVVKFLQETLASSNGDGQSHRSLDGGASVQSSVRSIQHLIPDGPSLRCVLECTERYWSVWPLGPHTTDEDKPCFPYTIPDAIVFVDESLRSKSRGTVVKCLVWLTICIQQLPKDFEETTARLPLRPCDLISHYLNVVDALTLNNGPPLCDLDCIEAMVLQYKVFVNMGRPQRAWKCTRSALDSAILLGLHRVMGDDEPEASRKKRLWTALWQHDRHLAVFLGLPYTVPEQYIQPPPSRQDGVEVPAEQLFFHHLNIVCGLVVDRDQLHRESSFSATARIVEEMDKLERMIPDGWEHADVNDRSTPLGVSFWRRAALLLFHCVKQLVHLPYVKTAASGDKRHEYSRCAALESAESIMHSYHGVRAMEGVPIICEFLDFCAFHAGLVLATDLISEEDSTEEDSTTRRRSEEEATRLWGLILRFIGDMRRAAGGLDCAVIEQSAEIMEYVYAARYGTYSGPEVFEATIPFFGRMKINSSSSPSKNAAVTEGETGSVYGSAGQGAIEINTNAFNFRLPADFQSPYELGDDWTVDLDFDCDYDWNGVFEFK